MYTVYILFSSAHDEIHIGNTSDLNKDLLYHNSLATEGPALQYRPWELFYFEEYDSKQDAILREQELQSEEGREYIWDLIRNKPEVISVSPPEADGDSAKEAVS